MTQIKDLNSIAYDGTFYAPIQRADGTTGKILIAAIGNGLSSWQLKTASYTAVAGDRLRIDASVGDVVITLPVTPLSSDADIWFQRIDTSAFKVLLRTGNSKINTQTGKDGIFSPTAIQTIERLSYVDNIIGWLGQFDRLTYQNAPVITVGDPFYANVTFLLRAASTGFLDLKGRAISYTGATLSTIAKYGGYSVLLSSGNISIPNPETLISPTGDWTIDFTYQNVSVSDYSAVFSLDGTDYPLTIYYGSLIGGNAIGAVGDNTSWYVSNVSMGARSTTQFNYYGLKREAGTISGWLNGVQISSFPVPATSAIGIPSGFAFLGQNGPYNASGYYDDFRITNGVARDLSIIPTGKFLTN